MKSRVLTAIGLIPIVLGAFFCASFWPIFALACLVGALCSYELATLLKRPIVYAGILSAFGAFFVPHEPFPQFGLEILIAGNFLLGVGCAAWCAAKRTAGILTPAIASFWFLAPVAALVDLHAMHPATSSIWYFKTPILLAVLPLWGGDTAAIFAGKAFGKHPLAPSISPNKTVEGSVANLLACVAVAIPLGLWIGYTWWVGALCGLVAGILGQVGDLFESYIKRQVDVKDSGTLLPGHGGLLDRIDSVLFTAPFVALILAFVTGHTV